MYVVLVHITYRQHNLCTYLYIHTHTWIHTDMHTQSISGASGPEVRKPM